MEAKDDDRGENGQVAYRIDDSRPKNDDWKHFRIDRTTGELILNTKLNPIQQSSYTVLLFYLCVYIYILFIKLYLCIKIDLIAYDRGKPTSLSARFTLVLVLVDETNNAAHFNRMQVCLHSSELECERDYQSVIVRFREEVASANNTVALNFAKISDLSKNSSDICYYLMGLCFKAAYSL